MKGKCLKSLSRRFKVIFRNVFGDVMSPRPRKEDEENESFKVPLDDESETATQLRQRRQIQIGAVSRIE